MYEYSNSLQQFVLNLISVYRIKYVVMKQFDLFLSDWFGTFVG